jgi:hypothetical protein
MRRSSQDVAVRIDLIKDAVANPCDDDATDDVSSLSMPRHEALLLDQLRAGNPQVYATLLESAVALNDADVFGANAVVESALAKLSQ